MHVETCLISQNHGKKLILLSFLRKEMMVKELPSFLNGKRIKNDGNLMSYIALLVYSLA